MHAMVKYQMEIPGVWQREIQGCIQVTACVGGGGEQLGFRCTWLLPPNFISIYLKLHPALLTDLFLQSAGFKFWSSEQPQTYIDGWPLPTWEHFTHSRLLTVREIRTVSAHGGPVLWNGILRNHNIWRALGEKMYIKNDVKGPLGADLLLSW